MTHISNLRTRSFFFEGIYAQDLVGLRKAHVTNRQVGWYCGSAVLTRAPVKKLIVLINAVDPPKVKGFLRSRLRQKACAQQPWKIRSDQTVFDLWTTNKLVSHEHQPYRTNHVEICGLLLTISSVSVSGSNSKASG